ncbi:RsmB/NOP family class I SAM-dependent RNA methyltransferase [Catenuloplanes sp. NPDC051500]|uniref:RsmB/NOP family class I SAM-dependent RNA methyltransferase n=1 Tax=Catenuloplanes sp. NPDC051500 TaxID=3363959 RepID=UPI0037B15E36
MTSPERPQAGSSEIRSGLDADRQRPASGSSGSAASSGDRGASEHRADRPHNAGRPRRSTAPGDGRGQDRDSHGGGRAPRGGRPPSDPARSAAYEAIAATHRDDAYANLVLPQILQEMRLFGRDAAFATELTYGTLRLVGTLDEIIKAAAGREVERIDPPARDAMRLGAYQILHTRVPAHAAVSSTVDLVRSVAPGAAGFANAVLRQITTKNWDEWIAEVAPKFADDPIANLSVTHAHPPWIVRAFSDALGGDLADTARALAEDNERPPVHLCARPGRADAITLADELGGAPGAFSPYAVYLAGGSPGDLSALAEGRVHVQDEGSQLVATALTQAEVEGTDENWLDLCAGPGGKAGLLGALAAGRGARVTAVEVAEHRARLVSNATRGLPVTTIVADGRTAGTGDLPAASFDRILVDAPCTGLGSLRRRPEARWRRQPTDLPPLTSLQRELLVAALKAVRPGGVVAYVVCSPHVVETQVTVTEAARRSKLAVDFVDARPLLPAGMPGLGAGPTVQLWPHRHGTDAMFLAVLRRTA